MKRTFNMGIGMVLVVSKEAAERILGDGEATYRIGEVISSDGYIFNFVFPCLNFRLLVFFPWICRLGQREGLVAEIDKVADAVSVTLGPKGLGRSIIPLFTSSLNPDIGIYKFYPPRISKLLIARGQLWKGHYTRYLKAWFETGVGGLYNDATWGFKTAASSSFTFINQTSTNVLGVGVGQEYKLGTYLYIQMEYCPRETEEKPGWCSDPHLPPCAGFVEIIAPVFSRESWQCVWHLIQMDL
ncbi:hypothetical protein L2E82_38390 [Cichorium intybus]|uniref:Uncharacterized protein n=1 Tax=Cichorium intybus TaxID=13427 RepID=A0ACB9AGM5_CICIN|nr:hypothetical protein L2E82_38390 [Cichorium intybus]